MPGSCSGDKVQCLKCQVGFLGTEYVLNKQIFIKK